MLVSQSQAFLKIPWKPFQDKENDKKVYYVKAIFESQLYSVMVTDLKYVWFEHCSFDNIVEKSKKHRIDVEKKEQVEKLITYFKQSFEMKENLSFVQLDEKLELHCGYEMGIMKLNWVFDCELLKYQTTANSDQVSGPEALYQHLISPSKFVINNNSTNNKGNNAMAFTQSSLDLIASFSEDQSIDNKNAEVNSIKDEASSIKIEDVKIEESRSQEEEEQEQRRLAVQEQLERTIREQEKKLQGRKKRRIL